MLESITKDISFGKSVKNYGALHQMVQHMHKGTTILY